MSIENKLFELTGQKAMPNDPVVEIIKGFKQVMEEAQQDLINNQEDLKEWGAIFTKQFEDSIAEIALKNNVRLEILEDELTGVVTAISEELKTVSDTTLTSFDSKAKDLNMLLTKIQINHERDTSDNFAKHLTKIDERYNQMLKMQKENNSFSKREVLFAVGGLVAGVAVCL
ncbi:MAG: hypothetical protein D8B60_12925, partial [Moraxella sp.]